MHSLLVRFIVAAAVLMAAGVVEVLCGVEAAGREFEEIADPLSEVEGGKGEEFKVGPGADEPGEEADRLTVGPEEERVAEEHRPPLPDERERPGGER